MTLTELLAHDETVSQQLAQHAQKPVVHAIAWIAARTGDSIFWLLVSSLLIWLKWPVAWPLLITVAVTALLTAVAKGIFKRERPVAKWAIATDVYSFPSGHSARAGAVAITLAFAFPPYAIVLIFWSVFVALARVMLSKHYMIDVIGGLLFGILIGLLLQYPLRYFF